MDKTTTGRRAAVGASGYKVRAVVWTDDQQKRCRFDAAAWFEQATDDDIRDLHEAEYQGDTADALAYAAEERKNRAVANLFRYLTTFKPYDLASGGIVGFEVRVNPADVYHYLQRHRPMLCAVLFPDGEPEFRQC